MEKFIIEQKIQAIEGYFYCSFSPQDEFYKDKAQTFISVYNIADLNPEIIRENLFIILNEKYDNFKNEFYL